MAVRRGPRPELDWRAAVVLAGDGRPLEVEDPDADPVTARLPPRGGPILYGRDGVPKLRELKAQFRAANASGERPGRIATDPQAAEPQCGRAACRRIPSGPPGLDGGSDRSPRRKE